MIATTLEHLVLSVEGCRAAMLVGHDGMPVDSVVVDDVVEPDVLAAGMGDLLKRATNVLADADVGTLQHLELRSGRLSCVVRVSAPGYFLVGVFTPETDLDACREELRRSCAALAADLTEMPSDVVTIRDSHPG